MITPSGLIAFMVQIAGNRHDVMGLYSLLETSFVGHLLGDNSYWPKPPKRKALQEKGITVTAATREDWHFQHSPEVAAALSKTRYSIERRFSMFNEQFHADRTLCRSPKHYFARRWTKALAHNASRYINAKNGLPHDSVQHFHIAA